MDVDAGHLRALAALPGGKVVGLTAGEAQALVELLGAVAAGGAAGVAEVAEELALSLVRRLPDAD